MRDYATPLAFRAAVEARLRDSARRLGIPAYILRRQAALERLIVRLTRVAPDRWAVKGGFALVSSETLREAGVGLAVRYGIESSLAGRPYEPVQVDVTIAPPVPWDAQPARRPGLLAELGFDPIDLLIPLERQIAEKLHAYTRTYKSGRTTRVRDLVDLLLILEHERVEAAPLRDSILDVFNRRATHPVPERLPPPPRELSVAYRREAERVGLVTSLDDAHQLLSDWLDPVLAGIDRAGVHGNKSRQT